MSRRITRLILLLALGGALFAAARLLRRRRTVAANAAARSPEWPPFEPRVQPGAAPTSAQHAAEPATVTSNETSDEQAVEAPAWLPPADGACPDGYPIKANDNSRIYHVPGGRSYERTIAERCYATAQAAERDGYRRAKA